VRGHSTWVTQEAVLAWRKPGLGRAGLAKSQDAVPDQPVRGRTARRSAAGSGNRTADPEEIDVPPGHQQRVRVRNGRRRTAISGT